MTEYYEDLYNIQKKKVQQKIKDEMTIHEKKITKEIKEAQAYSGKKMWSMIHKLRGINQNEKEIGVYDESGNMIDWDILPEKIC